MLHQSYGVGTQMGHGAVEVQPLISKARLCEAKGAVTQLYQMRKPKYGGFQCVTRRNSHNTSPTMPSLI